MQLFSRKQSSPTVVAEAIAVNIIYVVSNKLLVNILFTPHKKLSALTKAS